MMPESKARKGVDGARRKRLRAGWEAGTVRVTKLPTTLPLLLSPLRLGPPWRPPFLPLKSS